MGKLLIGYIRRQFGKLCVEGAIPINELIITEKYVRRYTLQYSVAYDVPMQGIRQRNKLTSGLFLIIYGRYFSENVVIRLME